MKKRLLYNQLKKYFEHKNALIITGMRQVGKTTLAKQCYEDIEGPKLWFDFENPLDLMLFESKNYDAIYDNLLKEAGEKNKKLTVFIDEIQNFPPITKIIKYHIDKYGVKYIVTGSSNFYLKNLFPESLSGRKFLFVLNPLSFKEYLYFKDIVNEVVDNGSAESFLIKPSLHDFAKYESHYDDYIEWGGFPEVVLTDDQETKELVLKNIFASFFEKDLKILSDAQDIRELRDLILLLVPRTGNLIDITKISSELGINRVKVYSYLEFLQGVFFIKLFPKYSVSIDKTVAGGRKLYFSDNGILNLAGRVTDGQLFENCVVNQLSNYGELSFYNKRNTAEIDFILNKEIAFEVKLKGTGKDLQKMKKLSDSLGFKKSFLISKSYSIVDNLVCPMSI